MSGFNSSPIDFSHRHVELFRYSEPPWNNTRNDSVVGRSLNRSLRPPDVPFQLEDNPYAVPVNGYLSPLIILFTLITNLLVCVVLLSRNMRTATNTLLLAMAISDTLTGLWPLPCYIYFYIGGHHADYVPHSWCYTYFVLTEFLPTISHTASIWLTVGLALQRYLLVCHSLDSRRWCSVENTVKACIVVFLSATISQINRFFESNYIPQAYPSRLDPNQTITACFIHSTSFIASFEDVYYAIYYTFRVVFIHLVPCCALVILNALLIQTMRRARLRRAQLLKMNRKSECRRLAESNGTTLMLVAVVGVFLLVELPLAALFIIYIVENMAKVVLMDPTSASVASLFVNFCILLSYPVNFFIYCGMSAQFRNTFGGLFGCGIPGGGLAGGQASQTRMEGENGKAEEKPRCMSMTTMVPANHANVATEAAINDDDDAQSSVPMLTEDTQL